MSAGTQAVCSCGRPFDSLPQITSRHGAARPKRAGVRCSEWMDDARAALANAKRAVKGAKKQGEWNALVALEKAVKALDAGIHLKRRPSSIDGSSGAPRAGGAQ